MKKLRIVVSIALSVAFLLGVTQISYVPVNAVTESASTYVAIGDSITTGYGLENFNKNDIKNKSSAKNFVNRLGKKLNKNTVNLGIEGIDSTQLLQAITKPITAEQIEEVTQIKNASVISISIGGNNILQPLISGLNEKLGEGKSIYTASSEDIQNAAINLFFADTTAAQKLIDTVAAGAEAFNGDAELKKAGDFAEIISTIKNMNPKAQIIVQTIYTPYKLSFIAFCDTAIKSMNDKIIKDSANGKNYKVADVYSAFSKAKAGTTLVNADSGASFDPHPTAKGHEVIYTVVAAALNNTLPYNVKAAVTKGKLTTKVSAGELLLTITPTKGYKMPKNISLKIGKGASIKLTLINGKASVPIADVGSDVVVTGVCSK